MRPQTVESLPLHIQPGPGRLRSPVKLNTDSDLNWTVIPFQTEHQFRTKLNTNRSESDGIRIQCNTLRKSCQRFYQGTLSSLFKSSSFSDFSRSMPPLFLRLHFPPVDRRVPYGVCEVLHLRAWDCRFRGRHSYRVFTKKTDSFFGDKTAGNMPATYRVQWVVTADYCITATRMV